MTLTYDAVVEAAARIKPHAVRTPLLRAYALERALDAKAIYIKPESLQRTGSFKFRGAFNALASLTDEQRLAGVLAFSSGNHAQGVALAASIFGTPATIIMPEDAPQQKLEKTKSYGAKVVTYDRYKQDRDEVAQSYLQGSGLTLIPPFDHPDVIAGQGTAGLEICDDLKALKQKPDHVFICAGGGGLAAGQSLVFGKRFPKAKLYTVEPKKYDDLARSLASGQLETADLSQKSICDALLTKSAGKLTFPIMQQHIAQGLSVSDQDALRAVCYAMCELKLTVEPGGAVALAAAISGQVELRNKTAVVYLSGSNIDPAMKLRALTMI